MNARGLVLVTVMAALFALVVGVATAAAPAGPRVAFVRLDTAKKRLEIRSTDAGGARERVLVADRGRGSISPGLDAISWSPDGSVLAFSAVGGGIRLVHAGGGDPLRVTGTAGGSSPVFSPDGRSLAFLKTKGSNGAVATPGGPSHRTFEHHSIWMIGIDGRGARRITPWRKRAIEVPSSFSPDGTTLAITRIDEVTRKSEASKLSLVDGSLTTIAEEALEPKFSPDGSQIAFVGRTDFSAAHDAQGSPATVKVASTTDLFSVASSGGDPRRLTQTPALDLEPSWDPSGSRLAYVEFRPSYSESAALGIGDALIEVNADGTCPTKILSKPKAGLYAPAWQPGPGREAGPIGC